MSASLSVVWMLSASNKIRVCEFAMMYTFKLYFAGWVPCVVCLCGNVAIFWT